MTPDDRAWFEQHVTDSLARIEAKIEHVGDQVGSLRERVRAAEVKSSFIAALVSAIVAFFSGIVYDGR